MHPARLILDTNVVLDWLVFANPACGALAAAIETRRVEWVSTVAIREELRHVLGRGGLERWQPDLEAIESAHERFAHFVEPCATAGAPGWRCRDPDDQKFIDLALQLGDATLLSRDRAVLHLARRAAGTAIKILTPERWAAQQTPPLPVRG